MLTQTDISVLKRKKILLSQALFQVEDAYVMQLFSRQLYQYIVQLQLS